MSHSRSETLNQFDFSCIKIHSFGHFNPILLSLFDISNDVNNSNDIMKHVKISIKLNKN